MVVVTTMTTRSRATTGGSCGEDVQCGAVP